MTTVGFVFLFVKGFMEALERSRLAEEQKTLSEIQRNTEDKKEDLLMTNTVTTQYERCLCNCRVELCCEGSTQTNQQEHTKLDNGVQQEHIFGKHYL